MRQHDVTRSIALLLAGLLMSACATGFSWHKEGASRSEIGDARAACQQEARSYGFLDAREKSERVPTSRGERYSNITVQTAEREADIFGACMRAKGFVLVPKDE
ncbi:MAG: hypothetical protein WCF16_07105 [Alphaproteobacteria bacterium]